MDGWMNECTDYYNRITKETSWKKPGESSVPPFFFFFCLSLSIIEWLGFTFLSSAKFFLRFRNFRKKKRKKKKKVSQEYSDDDDANENPEFWVSPPMIPFL